MAVATPEIGQLVKARGQHWVVTDVRDGAHTIVDLQSVADGGYGRELRILREIHRRIDHAVARAYGWDNPAVARANGWDDLTLDHDFYETRQGIRYTVGPGTRQEILDRLLELNHARYAEEARQGLHGEQAKKSQGKAAHAKEGALFG